jgi:hypothetical protein
MRRTSESPDERQYGSRSSEEVRGTLLRLTCDFVLAARRLPGVARIAVMGSLVTDKARPHDADVLVTITDDIEFDRLAELGRRLKGKAQGINSGADVFLADASGTYIGRVCHYRECHPRVLCQARHCGHRQHLNDDLDVLTLTRALIAAPPLIVHPTIAILAPVPSDVESLLLSAIRAAPTSPTN